MIDDDKIVKAASELCDYGSIHDSEYRIEGFKKCAKWMQEEFQSFIRINQKLKNETLLRD